MNRRFARSERWTPSDMPDQQGRTALITGANTGIGFEAARLLAEHGASVVLACRDLAKAEAAKERISEAAPRAGIATLHLDLASLASVRRAAEQFRASFQRLDLLVNNAGVIHPAYARTQDGFELHFGINHLGHFALTGLVLDRLLGAPDSRVVTVSSNGHRVGDIHLDDLTLQHGYGLNAAYGQSKLANLMFTYELQRRLAAAGAHTIAVAAHPGNAHTEVARHMPGWVRAGLSQRLRPLNSWMMQSAHMGSLPTLRAAVDPDATGGQYYGPAGLREFTGHPTPVESSTRSHDVDLQRRLWAESERLTGVTYRFSEQHLRGAQGTPTSGGEGSPL